MIPFIQKWGRLCIAVILFAAIISVLIFLSEILLPFILACFLAYVFAPLIKKIHQQKIRNFQIPRGLAVIFVYVVILGTLIGGGTFMLPNLSNEITLMLREMPEAINQNSEKWLPIINEKVNHWLSLIPPAMENSEISSTPISEPSIENKKLPSKQTPYIAALEQYTYEIRPLDSGRMEIIPHRRISEKPTKAKPLDLRKHFSSIFQTAVERIQENTINFLNLGRQVLAKIAGSIFTLFLTLMISAFILIDVDRVLNFGESLLLPKYHLSYERFLEKLDQGLNGVVRGQIIICLVNGTFTGIGLLIFNIPFAFTLSLIATICSLIPIFGTFLSSFPIVLMALTVSFPTALLIIGWILLIHFIEGNILNPKIIGTAAQIHPALVVFALVAGEYFAGIAGALLAVPIFSIIQTTFFFLKSMIEEIEPAAI
ncbi:MAG: AI-2E family transporter [SAR324 cluster bacterium]|nr:AI-2E family transporter [SAR324 cluster bacterium]